MQSRRERPGMMSGPVPGMMSGPVPDRMASLSLALCGISLSLSLWLCHTGADGTRGGGFSGAAAAAAGPGPSRLCAGGHSRGVSPPGSRTQGDLAFIGVAVAGVGAGALFVACDFFLGSRCHSSSAD